MHRAEEQLADHDAALRGTLDGRRGILDIVKEVLDRTQTHTSQLDALRLDRAKVAGIIIAVSVGWGVIYKLLLK